MSNEQENTEEKENNEGEDMNPLRVFSVMSFEDVQSQYRKVVVDSYTQMNLIFVLQAVLDVDSSLKEKYLDMLEKTKEVLRNGISKGIEAEEEQNESNSLYALLSALSGVSSEEKEGLFHRTLDDTTYSLKMALGLENYE